MDKMCEEFYAAKALQQKKRNSVAISDVKYVEIIENVKAAKLKERNKKNLDYWLLKKYDVLAVQGIEKLIFPVAEPGDGDIRYYVNDSELFGILHEAHLGIGHKARDAMEKHVKRKFINITQNDIKLYLSFCRPCHEKKHTKKEGCRCKTDSASRNE